MAACVGAQCPADQESSEPLNRGNHANERAGITRGRLDQRITGLISLAQLGVPIIDNAVRSFTGLGY